MNPTIDYIKDVKKCPPMFLGEYSLTNLFHQLKGLEYAYYIICKNTKPESPLIGFTEYVAVKYKDIRSLDYCGLILEHSNNEKEALNTFFDLFDEYLKLPAYKKNGLYVFFDNFAGATERDYGNFSDNLYWHCIFYGDFREGLSYTDLYLMFLQFFEKEKGITDAKNRQKYFSEMYQSEDKAFEEGFRLLTEFLKMTVGEDCYPEGLN